MPVMKAARADKYDALVYLHEQGADIHVQDELPLIIGIFNQNMDIIEYLVENNADVNVNNEHGRPLFLAVEHGSLEMVKYLVEHGADPSFNNHESTALAYDLGKWDILDYLESLEN